jgi:hypothetical protein
MHRSTILPACLLALALPDPATAQTIGTFRWQLQPYCNVIAVTITQVAGVYRVEGVDDQCGAATAASVIGTAFPNPNGSIGLGLNVVTTPGGTASPVDATIALATLSGTWRDGAGRSGTFAFTPGPGTGGGPRPLPGSTVPSTIVLSPSGSIVASGATGAIPASGSGVRMMWYSGKAAFRTGEVTGDLWDDARTGYASVALGLSPSASAIASIALGENVRATNRAAVALGTSTHAAGYSSTAMGFLSVASGGSATAAGTSSTASGLSSTALGSITLASGEASLASGDRTTASGLAATALGQQTTAGGNFSIAGGRSTHSPGIEAFAFGVEANAAGVGSVVLGRTARTTASAPGSFVFADRSTTAPFESNAANEFGARFAGGYYFYTRNDLSTGAALAPNSGSWAVLSDANSKENFRDLDGEDLLARLARVPVREWSYKAQGPAIRHIGPTAQDFRAAFGLGDFPLRINTVDADGVALAGVQALDARTRALQAENDALRAAVTALRRDLDSLVRERERR